jgi:hypothetical protein
MHTKFQPQLSGSTKGRESDWHSRYPLLKKDAAARNFSCDAFRLTCLSYIYVVTQIIQLLKLVKIAKMRALIRLWG